MLGLWGSVPRVACTWLHISDFHIKTGDSYDRWFASESMTQIRVWLRSICEASGFTREGSLMTEPGRSAGSDEGGRRRKRFLSPSQKYEIWVGLLRGEYSTREAADRAGVDRSRIMRVREVAKQGALDALASSRPGVRQGAADPELAEAKAEIARLSEALKEMGVRLMLAEGKERWG